MYMPIIYLEKKSYEPNSISPSFDMNERLGVTSFKGHHENWEHDPFQDFSKWAPKCFSNVFFNETH
jgi:hypothetical protein